MHPSYENDETLKKAVIYAVNYVRYRARKMPSHVDVAKMESDVKMRVYHAWKTYDPESGVEWDYWLKKHIRWGFSDAVRERNTARRDFHESYEMLSLDDVTRVSQDTTISNYELTEDGDSHAAQKAIDLNLLIQSLDKRSAWVITERYLKSRSVKEISRQTGTPETTLRRWEKEALDKMREAMNEDE